MMHFCLIILRGIIPIVYETFQLVYTLHYQIIIGLFTKCSCRDNDAIVKQLSIPSPKTSDLYFLMRFPQTFWEQFKSCLWKQCLSHWRSPSYNLVRIVVVALCSLLFGALYWQQGNIAHMYVRLLI